MNRYTTFSICLLVLLTFRAATALDIFNDNGGSVWEYAKRFEHAQKPIRVYGPCRSACTLALAYPDTCAGPDAAFVFHAPFNAGSYDKRIARWMIGRYPADIRSWIDSHGGLTAAPITLQGAELRKRVRACL